MKRRHPHHQQPGVVLLLALLLLAAVSASTIGTAVTISRSASQSSNLDNFIVASLAGDSGIERSLTVVKLGRRAGTITGALTSINTALATAQPVVSAGSRATFSGSARAVSDPIVINKLKAEESSSFDVLEYSAAGALLTSSARYLDLKGTTTAGALELSWVLLDQNGEAGCTGRSFIGTSSINAGISPSLLTNVTNPQGDPCTELNPKGFRIKVRALDVESVSAVDEAISNLVIEAYPCNIRTNPGGCSAAGLPGRIQVDVTGSSGDSKAVKTASVLWQLPVSGIFNYVLFTEGDIIPN